MHTTPGVHPLAPLPAEGRCPCEPLERIRGSNGPISLDIQAPFNLD